MKYGTKLARIGGGAMGLAIIVCIAIAANVLLGNLNLRLDLTEENLYRLSNGTREILADLKTPVTLKFFFSGSSAEVPVQIKRFGRRIEDLLVEYEMASGGKIIVEKYDPQPDSDAEEWAQKYGINGQPIGLMGPQLYLGIVASAGDTDAVLPVLDPRAEDRLEYNLTRMITRIGNPSKSVLGVISSLPVLGSPRSPYPMPGQPPPQPAWVAFQELQADYDVRQLTPPISTIDADIDALILVHPKDLSDETLYAIDQYVLRGGRLLAFLDPLSVVEAEAQQNPQMRFSGNSSNIAKLLEAWGVTFDSGKVVADLEAVSRLRAANNAVEDSPVWLSLKKRHFNSNDILTSNIESIMMPFAGAFSVDAGADVDVTSLIASSESSGLVDAMTAQFSMDGVRRNFKSGMKRLDLAVRLHGKLRTAFPDGKPAGDADSDAESTADTGLKESVDKSTVMLVGDADHLFDRFCVQEINFLGMRGNQPINDNLTLFANEVEQVAGSAALVSIRTRGKTERPFDVVLNLERQAQEKYMETEMQLQQKLEDAQQRLNEIQARKGETQRFIVSPEQQREVANFKEQVADTKKQLKLVRRKLRGDIERLGIKLKVLNILLMPALVCVTGVGLGFYRSKKNRRR